MRIALTLLIVVAIAGVAQGQIRGVTAEVSPIVGADGVHAGSVVRAALQVALPEGFHVQSNKPRDPSLIPTALTVDPPAGISVAEIVFPNPIDLKQIGADQPLAVFEREFTIGVRFAVAPTHPVGDIAVPAELRYQACNDTTCFAPTKAATQWKLRVVPAGAALTPGRRDLFDR